MQRLVRFVNRSKSTTNVSLKIELVTHVSLSFRYQLQEVQSEKSVKNERVQYFFFWSIPAGSIYVFHPFFPVHLKHQMNIDRGGAQSLGRNLNVQWNERDKQRWTLYERAYFLMRFFDVRIGRFVFVSLFQKSMRKLSLS